VAAVSGFADHFINAFSGPNNLVWPKFKNWSFLGPHLGTYR
jgi:hypothetical protein